MCRCSVGRFPDAGSIPAASTIFDLKSLTISRLCHFVNSKNWDSRRTPDGPRRNLIRHIWFFTSVLFFEVQTYSTRSSIGASFGNEFDVPLSVMNPKEQSFRQAFAKATPDPSAGEVPVRAGCQKCQTRNPRFLD